MLARTENQESCHGECQDDEAEPFLRCPQKNHGEQGTQENYADHEEHGSRAQLHAQLTVSRSVDDVDHQVREHKSSSVFDCAIHRLFMSKTNGLAVFNSFSAPLTSPHLQPSCRSIR